MNFTFTVRNVSEGEREWDEITKEFPDWIPSVGNQIEIDGVLYKVVETPVIQGPNQGIVLVKAV